MLCDEGVRIIPIEYMGLDRSRPLLTFVVLINVTSIASMPCDHAALRGFPRDFEGTGLAVCAHLGGPAEE